MKEVFREYVTKILIKKAQASLVMNYTTMVQY